MKKIFIILITMMISISTFGQLNDNKVNFHFNQNKTITIGYNNPLIIKVSDIPQLRKILINADWLMMLTEADILKGNIKDKNSKISETLYLGEISNYEFYLEYNLYGINNNIGFSYIICKTEYIPKQEQVDYKLIKKVKRQLKNQTYLTENEISDMINLMYFPSKYNYEHGIDIDQVIYYTEPEVILKIDNNKNESFSDNLFLKK